LSNSSNINNSSGSSLTPTPGATHNQYIHAPAIHIVHEAMVNCLCAIGDFQIMCGDRHGVVRLYDLRHTEAPVHTLALASKAPITSIAAQAHRGVVAVNAYDNVVHILEHTGDGWVLAAESAAGVYRNKHWPIRGAFTRDGLYATGSADGNMVVLRYHALGRSVHVAGTMEAHEDKVFAVAAHPQRDVLASAGADSGIKVWQRNW
jgi:WD40 repeat protein